MDAIELKKRKIAIVDDHLLFRLSFKSLLESISQHEIVFEASNGKEALDMLEIYKTDIVFMDIEMPIMDGIDATFLIKEKHPNVKVIILSMHNEEELNNHLIEKGASGIITKMADKETVLDAINDVFKSRYCENYAINSLGIKEKINDLKIRQTFSKSSLSAREMEVVKLMCKQYTNRQIAETLCISPRTVDTYRENIFSKTKSKNLAGVVLYAIKHHILE